MEAAPPGLDPGQALGLHTLRVTHAVNKEAIVRDILKGTGIPAVGPLLPGTWAFEPNVKKYAYDPATAKKLLAAAGYPNGLEVEFWVPESGSGMQAPVEMATVIQANLAAAGVKASRKTFEWARRTELYRRAQRMIVEDAPWIFVDHEVQVIPTRASLKRFKLHPSGFDLRVESVMRE